MDGILICCLWFKTHAFAIGYSVAWLGVAERLANLPTSLWLATYVLGFLIAYVVTMAGYWRYWIKPVLAERRES